MRSITIFVGFGLDPNGKLLPKFRIKAVFGQNEWKIIVASLLKSYILLIVSTSCGLGLSI